MNSLGRTLIVLAVLTLSATAASAALYTGSLTYTPPAPPDSSDGIFADGYANQWPDYTITMSWTVTDELAHPAGFPWHYSYTLALDGDEGGGISHVIIEGSEGISAGDITGLVGAALASDGEQKVTSGNPGMPENMWGLRFNPPAAGEYLTLNWSFFCDRTPVWGDFYSKDGQKGGTPNIVYNYNKDALGNELGFVVGDADPTDAPSDGSVDYHILRPDTVVPEPATLALLAVGGLAMIRRRKHVG